MRFHLSDTPGALTLALGVTLLLLSTGQTSRAQDSGKAAVPEVVPLPVEIKPGDPGIRYQGRFDTGDPAGPRCSWSASTVALRFSGTALNVRLTESGNGNEFQIVVDGKPGPVLVPQGGTHLYSLFTSSSGGEHTVELVKRTEAFFGITRFDGFQLAQGGRLLAPPPRPRHRIEVIGDSISCGYGNEGKDQNEHFSSKTENAYLTYGAITARRFGAEYVCTAWSGRTMWPKNTIGEVYDRTLPTDPQSRWDFAQWTPEVVIITLGTNDFAAGIPERKPWIDGYRAFIARVRKNYPKASLYCATSPMMAGDPYKTLQSYLEEIIQAERAAGDTNIRLLLFETQDSKDGFGADWHPNVKTQQNMAEKLSAALTRELNWKPIAAP